MFRRRHCAALLAAVVALVLTAARAQCPPAAGDFCPFGSDGSAVPWSTRATSGWFRSQHTPPQGRPYWSHGDPFRSEMDAVLRMCADYTASCPRRVEGPFIPPFFTPAPFSPRFLSAWEDQRFGWALSGAVEHLRNILADGTSGEEVGPGVEALISCASQATRFPRLYNAGSQRVDGVSLDCSRSQRRGYQCRSSSERSFRAMALAVQNTWPEVRSCVCDLAAKTRRLCVPMPKGSLAE